MTRISRLLSALLPVLALLSFESMAAQRTPHIHEMLRSDHSARAAAMAGAFVSVPGDPNGIFYNPALLATIDSVSPVSISVFKHVLDINSGSLAAASQIEGVGGVGAALTYTSYGSFNRTDRNGNGDGTFSSQDIVLTLGWGSDLGEGFSAGVGGEVIFSSIESYSSSAVALNGGLYWADTGSRVQAGLSILHLGTQLSGYGEVDESLPLDLRFGVSHQLRGLPLLLAVDFSQLFDEGETALDRFSSFSIGGEFTLADPLRLRLGYDNRVRQDVSFGGSKGLAGLSAGLGLLVSDYRFDYGFTSLSGLGSQHRITLATEL